MDPSQMAWYGVGVISGTPPVPPPLANCRLPIPDTVVANQDWWALFSLFVYFSLKLEP